MQARTFLPRNLRRFGVDYAGLGRRIAGLVGGFKLLGGRHRGVGGGLAVLAVLAVLGLRRVGLVMATPPVREVVGMAHTLGAGASRALLRPIGAGG